MIPVLTEIADGSPEMLFFPIFQPEGDFIVQQAGDVAGLEGITMMAADGLLNSNYMAIPETEGMYFSCLLYTSPSPRDQRGSRMPSSA